MATAKVRNGGVKKKLSPRNERKEAISPPRSPPIRAAPTTDMRYSIAALVSDVGDCSPLSDATPVATPGRPTAARSRRAAVGNPDGRRGTAFRMLPV